MGRGWHLGEGQVLEVKGVIYVDLRRVRGVDAEDSHGWRVKRGMRLRGMAGPFRAHTLIDLRAC
jgi:hypothetical protein